MREVVAAAPMEPEIGYDECFLELAAEKLDAYKVHALTANDKNILFFWKHQSTKFPLLAKVARKVFATQISSRQ